MNWFQLNQLFTDHQWSLVTEDHQMTVATQCCQCCQCCQTWADADIASDVCKQTHIGLKALSKRTNITDITEWTHRTNSGLIGINCLAFECPNPYTNTSAAMKSRRTLFSSKTALLSSDSMVRSSTSSPKSTISWNQTTKGLTTISSRFGFDSLSQQMSGSDERIGQTCDEVVLP